MKDLGVEIIGIDECINNCSVYDETRMNAIYNELDDIWEEIDKECNKNENYDKENYNKLKCREKELMREHNEIASKYK